MKYTWEMLLHATPTGITVRQLCSNFKLTVGGYKESQATVIIMYETVPVMVTVTFHIPADCYPNCQATVITMWEWEIQQ